MKLTAFRMMSCEVLLGIWLLLIDTQLTVSQSSTAANALYHSLYHNAVTAYNQQRWFECYTWMTKALQDYRSYNYEAGECWITCQTAGGASLIDIDKTNFLQPQPYLNIAKAKSECFSKCKQSKFPDRLQPPQADVEAIAIDREIESLTPYDYLQFCAFKSEQYEDAMSAAYTFLSAHPNHEYMTKNVEFYRSLPEAKTSYFRNLEAKQFETLYIQGEESYGSQDWLGTIKYMEESLQQYYAELRRCLAFCDQPLEEERLKKFLEQVAIQSTDQDRKRVLLGHWSQILECKERCRVKLDTVNGHSVSEHFNYLQFSYYKINDLKRAAECAGTYLLWNPSHEIMLHNKEFYLTEHRVAEEDFTPRKEPLLHAKSRQRDLDLLIVVRKNLANMSLSGRAAVEQDAAAGGGGRFDESAVVAPKNVFSERDESFVKELEDYKSKLGVTVVAENETLLGNHRVVIDGLISEDQCKKLVELATMAATKGDGYEQAGTRTSPPHTTAYEKFEGLAINRAAELARDGLVPVDRVSLFLEASELGRAFLDKYYNLNIHLMFQYTHLVCRTALDVNQSERTDLSDPLNSDNCFIQPDGSCLKRPPAYIYRDFTGLIYLNDDFEGGDFFFAHRNLSVQLTLHPKCGRFVGFDAGDYHGLFPVTSGRRCALIGWYTLNPRQQELARAEALMILRSMGTTAKSKTNPPGFKDLQEKIGDFQLTMTEDDLNGRQRFAVDDFANYDQCQELIKLAHEGAEVGDGYKSGDSPHTRHEVFEGLAVEKAAQLAAEHKVSAEAVKLYLTMTRDVLELTRVYLTPNTPLYFAYTHLVCRTALNDQNLDRTDLSHPIHSDNCIIQPDNSCLRQRPAYTERDFSAILYLNDNFHGGDFFFTHRNMSVQSSLRPKCGRVVAFNASDYHGVRPVLSGQRCAVALWFTLDQNFKEHGHTVAWDVLKQLEARAFGPNEHAHVDL